MQTAKKVYLLPMHHNTPENAIVVLKSLLRVGEVERQLTVAVETNNDKEHRTFLRNLVHKSDPEIDGFVRSTFADFEVVLFKGLRELSGSLVRRVYPIAMGKEDQDYRKSIEILNGIHRIRPTTDAPKLEELVETLIKRMEGVNQIGLMRDPLMLKNIREVIACTDRPVAVLIGEGHIQYLQSNLPNTELYAIPRERNEFERALWGFMDEAESLLKEQGPSEAVRVALSKMALVQALGDRTGEPGFSAMLSAMGRVKSVGEAEEMYARRRDRTFDLLVNSQSLYH